MRGSEAAAACARPTVASVDASSTTKIAIDESRNACKCVRKEKLLVVGGNHDPDGLALEHVSLSARKVAFLSFVRSPLPVAHEPTFVTRTGCRSILQTAAPVSGRRATTAPSSPSPQVNTYLARSAFPVLSRTCPWSPRGSHHGQPCVGHRRPEGVDRADAPVEELTEPDDPVAGRRACVLRRSGLLP